MRTPTTPRSPAEPYAPELPGRPTTGRARALPSSLPAALLIVLLVAVVTVAAPAPAAEAAARCRFAGNVAPRVSIVNPSTRSSLESSRTVARVRAFDTNLGTDNGDGIAGVRLKIVNKRTGKVAYDRIDRARPYTFDLELTAGRYKVVAIAKSVCAAGGTRGAEAAAVRVTPALSVADKASAELLNHRRVAAGLRPLVIRPEMNTFALNWSRIMAASGFRHSGGPYGENIAWIGGTSLTAKQAAARFQDMWWNSQGHKANMLNSSYTHLGVGLFKNGRGWYATHVFSRS